MTATVRLGSGVLLDKRGLEGHPTWSRREMQGLASSPPPGSPDSPACAHMRPICPCSCFAVTSMVPASVMVRREAAGVQRPVPLRRPTGAGVTKVAAALAAMLAGGAHLAAAVFLLLLPTSPQNSSPVLPALNTSLPPPPPPLHARRPRVWPRTAAARRPGGRGAGARRSGRATCGGEERPGSNVRCLHGKHEGAGSDVMSGVGQAPACTGGV